MTARLAKAVPTPAEHPPRHRDHRRVPPPACRGRHLLVERLHAPRKPLVVVVAVAELAVLAPSKGVEGAVGEHCKGVPPPARDTGDAQALRMAEGVRSGSGGLRNLGGQIGWCGPSAKASQAVRRNGTINAHRGASLARA